MGSYTPTNISVPNIPMAAWRFIPSNGTRDVTSPSKTPRQSHCTIPGGSPGQMPSSWIGTYLKINN